MLHTLIVRPKSGKFLKDIEVFSKMDPFLKIYHGNSVEQTDVADSQGKTPKWTKTLSFKITQDELNDPETCILKIEAFDHEDNGKHRFLADINAYKLKNTIWNKPYTDTIQLLDKNKKPAGTVDIEFEVKLAPNFNPHDMPGQYGMGMNQMNSMDQYGYQGGFMDQSGSLHNMPNMPGIQRTSTRLGQQAEYAGPSQPYTLIVRPKSGRFLKDIETFSKMDPFLKIALGKDVKESDVAHNQGKTPKWTKELRFICQPQQILQFEIEAFDHERSNNHRTLGKNTYKVNQAVYRNKYTDTIKILEKYDKEAGTIDVEFEVDTKELLNTAGSAGVSRQTTIQGQGPMRGQTMTGNLAGPAVVGETYTLKVKPKSGKFLKDIETFSKMDPFLKITIGKDVNQSDVAHNQGKTPKWDKTLSYVIQPKVAQMDQAELLIEAFDYEDSGKHRFLGEAVYKVPRTVWRSKIVETIQLLNKMGKNAGTVDVEFEIDQTSHIGSVHLTSPTSQTGPLMVSPNKLGARRPIGTVVVRPIGGRIDQGVIDRSLLYLVFLHGDLAYQTNFSEGPGRRPFFRDIVCFQLFEGEDMTMRLFDDDPDRNDMVGEAAILLSVLVKRGVYHDLMLPLMNLQSKKVGELQVQVEFFADVFDNPVKMYPTVYVRPNEYIPKKIRYFNPDRFPKNIQVRSENESLIEVNSEKMNVLPEKFVEIKLKFHPPMNGFEDKCRIDIALADTNVIDESLLFKVAQAPY